MVFIWSDSGITKEYKFGVRLHGLKQKGKRPDTVIFTDEELKSIDYSDLYLRKMIYQVLRKQIKWLLLIILQATRFKVSQVK